MCLVNSFACGTSGLDGCTYYSAALAYTQNVWRCLLRRINWPSPMLLPIPSFKYCTHKYLPTHNILCTHTNEYRRVERKKSCTFFSCWLLRLVQDFYATLSLVVVMSSVKKPAKKKKRSFLKLNQIYNSSLHNTKSTFLRALLLQHQRGNYVSIS